MPPKPGHKQSAEHIARRIAARYPSGPAMTTITCRFCGSMRLVLAKNADRYTTCGAADCIKRRRVEGGSQSKGKGEANPRFKDGQWTRGERTCAVCTVTFTGPARRRYCSPACSAKGRSITMAGIPLTEARKARMKGRSGTGPKSEAWKAKMSVGRSGANNPQWKGGITDVNKAGRTTWSYKRWRVAVLTRDANACRVCGTTERVIAHHIKHYADAPDLRVDLANGMALCHSCHKRLHLGLIPLPH